MNNWLEGMVDRVSLVSVTFTAPRALAAGGPAVLGAGAGAGGEEGPTAVGAPERSGRPERRLPAVEDLISIRHYVAGTAIVIIVNGTVVFQKTDFL